MLLDAPLAPDSGLCPSVDCQQQIRGWEVFLHRLDEPIRLFGSLELFLTEEWRSRQRPLHRIHRQERGRCQGQLQGGDRRGSYFKQEPSLRPEWRADYFAANIGDPDGYNIEIAYKPWLYR